MLNLCQYRELTGREWNKWSFALRKIIFRKLQGTLIVNLQCKVFNSLITIKRYIVLEYLMAGMGIRY